MSWVQVSRKTTLLSPVLVWVTVSFGGKRTDHDYKTNPTRKCTLRSGSVRNENGLRFRRRGTDISAERERTHGRDLEVPFTWFPLEISSAIPKDEIFLWVPGTTVYLTNHFTVRRWCPLFFGSGTSLYPILIPEKTKTLRVCESLKDYIKKSKVL